MDSQINTAKTITTFGSIFLFVNNTVGPGMMLLPAMFQEGGWLPNSIAITLLCGMSYIIAIMLTNSIRKIPNNKNDDLRVEYLDLINYYMGFTSTSKIIMRICQFMYILFMLSLLIGSMIQTCQTFDFVIARIFGHSFGVTYFPFNNITFVEGNSLDSISPFNNNDYILSIGTILIYLLIIKFCLQDLSEAIWIQYIGAYGSFILIILWCIMSLCSEQRNANNVPIGTSYGLYDVLSVNFYNVAFVCTFPSWLNEKKQNVSTKNVLKWVCILTLLCFVFTGYFGGIAFNPYYMTSADMLAKLNNFQPNSNLKNQTLIKFFTYFGPISGYIYPLIQTASGIPVFCAIIRYNLLNTHILKTKWSANIIAIFIPFFFSIILYHGNGFNNLLNWTGLCFSSFINYILPIFFYYKSILRPKDIWYQIAESPH
eukprot:214136_1